MDCEHSWDRISEYGASKGVYWCRLCGALQTSYFMIHRSFTQYPKTMEKKDESEVSER